MFLYFLDIDKSYHWCADGGRAWYYSQKPVDLNGVAAKLSGHDGIWMVGNYKDAASPCQN